MIKLIRYADEGFVGYDYYSDEEYTPKLVNEIESRIEPWVCGCFVFIEEVDDDALIMFRKDRGEERRNEMLVADETLIWTPNIWVSDSDEKFNHQYFKDLGGMLTWNSWIRMPAAKIAERVMLAKQKYGKAYYNYSEGIFEVR